MTEGKELCMQLKLLEKRRNCGYASFGSVWGRGEAEGKNFVLRDEKGACIPMQTRVSAYWPDGSVKWATHTADARRMGGKVFIRPVEELPEDSRCETCIRIEKKPDGLHVTTKLLSFIIPEDKSCLFHSLCRSQNTLISHAYPVLLLEHEKKENNALIREERYCRGEIEEMTLEEEGELQYVFCFSGTYIEDGSNRKLMPYICRMYVSADTDTLRFVYTFLYDGDKNYDFLKGMGIRYETELRGAPYNRHVGFDTDGASFHEAAVLLSPSHPRLPKEIFTSQLEGEIAVFPEDSDAVRASKDMPVWSDFGICQDFSEHFRIYKRTKEECCYLDCRHGRRSDGVMMVGGENGSVMFGIRDFWKKYPAGLEACGLEKEMTECTVWFYSKGMGSRHNVRHWGCSCKEPRIAMAGHWRFYYYLTGDHRMGEVMEEYKDADFALPNVKYFNTDHKLGIWSGPDRILSMIWTIPG